jgi:coenzyme F420-reducing hydrogenase alpha subunit
MLPQPPDPPPASAPQVRTIKVGAVTRVEGEGALSIRLLDGTVEEIELRIYEAPRYFEALLRGRKLEEAPDITARICGICPVAYQMSAVHAMENALSIKISPEIRQLRRLLYCGEWIESHTLHIHLLHAPDFLGYDSGIAMAKDYPDQVKRGLRLKKHGNELVALLGGRAIHPINVAVGGFYRAPTSEELQALVPDLQWGVDAAIEATRWVGKFAFPGFDRDYDLVSLVHPDQYPMNEGGIGITSGAATIPVQSYEHEFEERHVPHSTALHSVRKSTQAPYLVGPLARMYMNWQRLTPGARQLAVEFGFDRGCKNPYRGIVARAIEVVHAYEEALALIRSYRRPDPCRIGYEHRDATGCAATEAPRGLLYHRYAVGADGLIREAKIVPPTSQNQWQIETDLRALLPDVLDQTDEGVAQACEELVRSYDPCISCATHFLRVDVRRE